jgi:hypothetical protein
MIKRALDKMVAFNAAALCVCLTAGLAQADVLLIGTPAARPGDEVDFTLVVTAGTTFDSIDIIPAYDSFNSVLTLLDFQQTPALLDGNDGLGCIDAFCAIYYLQRKSFPEGAVLATWRFSVTDDAWAFVDANGEIPFDLGVDVGVDFKSDVVPLPDGQVFKVLAVPEPSSYMLLGAGLLLLIGSSYRRRLSVR